MSDNRTRYSSAPLQNVKKVTPPKGGNKPQPPRTVGDYQDASIGQRSFSMLQVMLTILLPIFFIIILLVPSNSLYLIFSAISAGCLLLMWLLNAFVPKARMTLSFIHIAMILVCLFAVWMSAPAAPAEQKQNQGVTAPNNSNIKEGNLADMFNNNTNASLAGMAEKEQSDFLVDETSNPGAASLAQQRLEQFMSAWMNNDYTNMVALSLPSWVSSHEDPEQAMFYVRGIRSPLNFSFESITGSDADNTRTVNMIVKMDKSNGQTPRDYLMQVLMMRVNNQWYVDPNSLASEQEVRDASVTEVPKVTVVPLITASPTLQLYFNPDGGTMYHTDANCTLIHADYLPLKGSFYFSEINDAQYSKLEPCTTCHAPSRI